MAEGTISRIIRGEFGFIKPDEGEEEVYFRLAWVRDVPLSGVGVGQRVEYEVRRTPRGLQTQWVKVTGAARRPAERRYRFLNPYNFVRPIAQTVDGNPLLGRCPPPTHDRYVGLTGRIICELTAVTPLFTSDSERVTRGEHDHYHFEFFRYEDKPAIPATSLRGPIRSVFEAATNSCFSVFAGSRRLSHHLESRKAPQLVPARVERLDDGWALRLLTGTTPLQIGRLPDGLQYAAWLYAYWPMKPSGTLRQWPPASQGVRRFQDRRGKGNERKLNGLVHGDACYALLEEMRHPFPRIRFWDVVAVSQDRSTLEKLKQAGQRIEQGWLCITNQNIEPKHSERFFFRAMENRAGPVTIDLPDAVRADYEDLIIDYQERHAAVVSKRLSDEKLLWAPINAKGAGLSRFIYKKDEQRLKGEELVYASLHGSPNQPEVEFIVPVSVPRVGYNRQVGELLAHELGKCEQIDRLCPACRTFGWVWGTDNQRQESPAADVQTAYAGRIRFSHAELRDNAGTFDLPLAILSSPKPTTVRFYLMAKDGRAQDGLDDDQVDYGREARAQTLRGRKFYRHHGDRLSEREYRRVEDECDDQNRSVTGVQKPGSKFVFEVSFENLASVELGALLWTLEMEGWCHRIGLGKPLGFGSAVIRVTGLSVLDIRKRYGTGLPGWTDAMGGKDSWVSMFKAAMAERYGSPFAELINICDLRALLAESPNLPVHYPRTDAEPLPEGRNFEWFIGNHRVGHDAGPRLTLRAAGEDTEGLPLLDKYGRVHDI